MVPRTIDLDDGVEAPPWPIFIQFSDEEFEEHAKGPIVGIGLHDTPIDFSESIDGNEHGESWGDQDNLPGNRISSTLPGLGLPVALAKNGLVDDEYPLFAGELV